MQYFSFDLGNFPVSLLFFLTTCQTSEPVNVTTEQTKPTVYLTEPRDEGQKDFRDVTTKLTLILMNNDSLYAFEGANPNNGKFYKHSEVRSVIKTAKKHYADKDFVVVIKPASKAIYSQTVNVLDEMVINKIERYSINKLFPGEKKLLDLDEINN